MAQFPKIAVEISTQLGYANRHDLHECGAGMSSTSSIIAAYRTNQEYHVAMQGFQRVPVEPAGPPAACSAQDYGDFLGYPI
jgi:hypothetical protein